MDNTKKLEERNDKLQEVVENVYNYIDSYCIIRDDDGTIHCIANGANMIWLLEELRKVR